jgi:hypothetical protein
MWLENPALRRAMRVFILHHVQGSRRLHHCEEYDLATAPGGFDYILSLRLSSRAKRTGTY